MFALYKTGVVTFHTFNTKCGSEVTKLTVLASLTRGTKQISENGV